MEGSQFLKLLDVNCVLRIVASSSFVHVFNYLNVWLFDLFSFTKQKQRIMGWTFLPLTIFSIYGVRFHVLIIEMNNVF